MRARHARGRNRARQSPWPHIMTLIGRTLMPRTGASPIVMALAGTSAAFPRKRLVRNFTNRFRANRARMPRVARCCLPAGFQRFARAAGLVWLRCADARAGTPRWSGAGCSGGTLRLADAEQRPGDLVAGVEQPVEGGAHVRVGDPERAVRRGVT